MLVEDREHHIFKLLFIILFWIFSRIVVVVTGIIAVIQWVALWFNESPNAQLLKFSIQLSIFQRQISEYMTFQSDEKVFPFADWPDAPSEASDDSLDEQK